MSIVVVSIYLQIQTKLTSGKKMLLWPYFISGDVEANNHYVHFVLYPHIRKGLMLNSFPMPTTDVLVIQVWTQSITLLRFLTVLHVLIAENGRIPRKAGHQVLHTVTALVDHTMPQPRADER